jgi:DNA-binding response OmpR family regulator
MLLGIGYVSTATKRNDANPATAGLAVVHLSGVYVTEEDRLRGRRAGADAYLLAPVTGQELAGTFDKLLDSSPKP